jgi:hypothetical protein
MRSSAGGQPGHGRGMGVRGRRRHMIHLEDGCAPMLTAVPASASMPAEVGSCRTPVVMLGQLDT